MTTLRRALKLVPVTGLLAVALAGCAGPAKIWTYDENAEVNGGEQKHKLIVTRLGAYPGKDLSEYVAAVGNKLAAVSERPALKWQFTVLDSPMPNAFATEGGYVYITRGMLALLSSEDDLAAVLAHEIAHICTRDALRAQTVGNFAGMGALAVVVAVAPAALLFPDITFAPLGAGMAAYSRQDELAADRHGAEYLRRAGYPAESMAVALEILVGLETYKRDHSTGQASGWTHRVFADHPDAGKRVDRLGSSTISEKADPEFLARLDALEFGSAKSSGIPSGGKLYFPQWDATVDVPDGWTASMNGGKLWLGRKDRKAVILLERVAERGTDDLCQQLLPFPKGTPVTNLQRSKEGQIRSCTGVARNQPIGVVSVDKTPSVRVVYRAFRGKFTEDDSTFLSIARSIRPLGENENRPKPVVLRIHKVQAGDTFASLAKASRIPDAEPVLRLLNQRYPGGDLEVGQLVKVPQ